ncbi:MAG: RDD family protein [Candidatus Methylomirabilales bacterium]
MRCQHCGYVSFDHLSVCPRCAKPLSPSRQRARASPTELPDADSPAVSRVPISPATVHEGRLRLEEPSSVAGALFEEEPDWSRLTLPAELYPHPSLSYGGVFRRGVAVLVDAPLLFGLTVLAMTLASLTAMGGGTVAGAMTRQVRFVASGAAVVAAFAVSLAYHVVCWGQGGQTPGKMLLGLQVVRWDGGEIGYGRAFLRWVGYFVALLPLGFGVILALFHPRRRGLHDLLAGTCVVRVNGPGREAGGEAI